MKDADDKPKFKMYKKAPNQAAVKLLNLKRSSISMEYPQASVNQPA